MNNEFKKSKSNNETRYTLESMTAGATGSGSIATSVGSVGKVQKRGNILAQEAGKDKVDASKPRNFVAKNAKMGGAGAHKDKKKEQKQGAEKHKKPYMEALKQKIEDLKSKLNEAQAEKKTGMVRDRKTGEWYDPKKEFDKKMNSPEVMAQMKRMATKEGKEDKIAQLKKDHETAVHWSKNETSPQKREAARQKAEKIKRHLDTQYKQGVAEGSLNEDKGFDVVKSLVSAFNNSVSGDANIPLAAERPGSRVFTRSDGTRYRDHGNIRFYQGYIDPQDVAKWKATNPVEKFSDWLTSQPGVKPIGQVSGEFRSDAMRDAVAYKGLYFVLTPHGSVIWGSVSRFKNPNSVWRQQDPKQGVAEGFNGEYDDEAGMAHSNLLTTARAVMGLLKTIKDRDNLPEWGQEKIAKAEMMLVSVWDYLQSQKEMGNDPQVAEDSIRSNLVTALQGLGFKGPFKLGQLPQWMKELQDGRFDKDTSIMIGGDDPAYDPWVAKGYDYGYAYGMESGYQTGLSAQEVIRQAKSDMSQGQDVAEGERTMSRAAKGHEKYGKAGMAALAKAGRDGAGEEKLDKIRDKHDKYNEGLEEAAEDRTSYQVAKILFDKGIKYDAAKENELINMIGMVLVKELMMSPKQARYLISYDEDFVSDTLGELGNMESSVSEVAPPGWEKTVKAMKKHDNIDNPFALAWSMKNKGYKSHKKESADPYFESLANKLDNLKKKK